MDIRIIVLFLGLFRFRILRLTGIFLPIGLFLRQTAVISLLDLSGTLIHLGYHLRNQLLFYGCGAKGISALYRKDNVVKNLVRLRADNPSRRQFGGRCTIFCPFCDKFVVRFVHRLQFIHGVCQMKGCNKRSILGFP